MVLVPPECLSQEYSVHTVEMEKDDHHTFLDIDICMRQVAVWTMKSTEAYPHKPLPELQITPPSFQQACHSMLPWCTGPGLCATEKSSMMNCRSTFKESGYSQREIQCAFILPARTPQPIEKPTLFAFLPYVQMHTSVLAECQLKTSSCLLVCHPGSTPVSSVLLKMMWN